MATGNLTLIQKADLAVADFAAGGLLQPAQAAEFIRLAIKAPVVISQAFVTPMTTPVERRDKMGFTGQVLQPGSEATALGVAERSVPALGFVELTTRHYKAETRMSDEVLEDQIERGAFKQTIMEELSKAVARDMERAALNGDTTSATPLLAMQDGWIRRATANIFDAGGATLSKVVLRDTLRALPDEYAEQAGLKYFTNRYAQIAYGDTLADRATALGDAWLTQVGAADPAYSKIPVQRVALFPTTLGGGGDQTVVLLTDPKNLALGIQRQIKIETWRDAPALSTSIIVSIRFALQVIEVNAMAKAINVRGR